MATPKAKMYWYIRLAGALWSAGKTADDTDNLVSLLQAQNLEKGAIKLDAKSSTVRLCNWERGPISSKVLERMKQQAVRPEKYGWYKANASESTCKKSATAATTNVVSSRVIPSTTATTSTSVTKLAVAAVQSDSDSEESDCEHADKKQKVESIDDALKTANLAFENAKQKFESTRRIKDLRDCVKRNDREVRLQRKKLGDVLDRRNNNLVELEKLCKEVGYVYGSVDHLLGNPESAKPMPTATVVADAVPVSAPSKTAVKTATITVPSKATAVVATLPSKTDATVTTPNTPNASTEADETEDVAKVATGNDVVEVETTADTPPPPVADDDS